MRALLLVAALALPLAAQKTHEFCAPCHSEQVADFKLHPHFEKGLSCDVCHGASVAHRTSTGATAPDQVAAPDEAPALCGTCHAAQQKEYVTSLHGKLVLARAKVKAATCTTCHGVHSLRVNPAAPRNCQRCHEALDAKHPATQAGVSCATCHAKHTMAAKRR